MTDTQHVTVNIHRPRVQQVSIAAGKHVISLGNNSEYHGTVDLFVTVESWRELVAAVDAGMAELEK